LTAEGDVAAHGKTTSSDSSVGQEVRSEGVSINNFDRAVARGVFGSTALESVSAWHGWFLSYNVEGRTKRRLVLPWRPCDGTQDRGSAGPAEAGEASG
jgi:hypothetical protein